MKRKKFFSLTAVLLFCLAFLFVPPVSAAGNVAVTLVPGSVTARPGQTVTLTVKFNNTTGDSIAAFDLSVRYDSDKLTYEGSSPKAMSELSAKQPVPGKINFSYLDSDGGSTPIKPTSSTIMTVTFKVKSGAPVSTVSFSGSTGTFTAPGKSELPASLTGASVNIGSALSGNALLASLSLDSGTLSPAFSSSGTSYACSVPYEVSSVKVTARAQNSKAKVSVSGGALRAGVSSQITVTVTAEDGTVKKYTISVKRAAGADSAGSSASQPVSSDSSSDDPASSQVSSVPSAVSSVPQPSSGSAIPSGTVATAAISVFVGLLAGVVIGYRIRSLIH